MEKKKIISFIQTRTGFLTLLVVCFWLKYIFAAYFDFNLGLSDPYQHFIMWLSPVGSAIILISFGFYIPKPLISYITMLILDFANTALLFANIIYYRQFSDFLTIKTMSNVGKVSQGLGKSTVALLHPTDIIIWIDLIVIVTLLIIHKIKIDQRSYGLSTPFAITSVGAFILTLNIFLAKLLVRAYCATLLIAPMSLNTLVLTPLPLMIASRVRKMFKSLKMPTLQT